MSAPPEQAEISVSNGESKEQLATPLMIPNGSFTDRAIGLLFDVSLLIPAGVLLSEAAIRKYWNISYDPKEVKIGKIPILLLHGKGYNQIQWKLGRKYLEQEEYGTTFSVDYDGLITNGDKKSIADYAAVVGEKIDEIKKLVGMNEIVLICHSLGGLVASFYAENLAAKQGTIVKHIITIATPWHEPPIMQYFKDKSVLYKEMTESNLIIMRKAASESMKNKIRSYYAIESKGDVIVPSPCGIIDDKIQKCATFKRLGHYAIVVQYGPWEYIKSLLDDYVYVNK